MKNYTPHPLRKVKWSDFLTHAEYEQVKALFASGKGNPSFAALIVYEVLVPILPRINAKLGLECDAWDLAYALEYGLFRTQPRKSPRK